MVNEMLVDLYLERNETAISCTQQIYGKRLNRLSFNIVKDAEDAKECENDTYLKTWDNIPPKTPKTYFFSFLAKITRNISINLYNKNHADKRFTHITQLTHEMEECIPNPNDEEMKISDENLSEIISKFLLSLKETEREIFIKRYWYCESIKEISHDFGFSESKIKSMLMRTRNKMKAHFESEGVDL